MVDESLLPGSGCAPRIINVMTHHPRQARSAHNITAESGQALGDTQIDCGS
jgi:hypothetical protein